MKNILDLQKLETLGKADRTDPTIQEAWSTWSSGCHESWSTASTGCF
ncbi:hypothetical protein [Nocardia sp. NPDC052316]